MARSFVMDGYTLPTGIMTQGDVSSMQKALGVTSDGIWGPKTQAAYNSYVQQRGEAAKYAYPNLRPPIGITTNAGVAALQGKLGIYSTGMWDQYSQDTLDQTLIRQLPHNKSKLADIEKMTPAEQYEFDMLGYEYGIGRDDRDYAIAGFDVPEWLDSKEKVASYQKLLGVREDGLWGPRTEAAHQDLLADIEWTNARQPASKTPYIAAANSAVKGGSIDVKPYVAAQGYATQPQAGYASMNSSVGGLSNAKNMAQTKEPEYGKIVVDVDPDAYWRLIYDNKSISAKTGTDEMDSMFYNTQEYFANTLDFQSLKNKADNLYLTTTAKYDRNHSALDISPGENENEYDVLRKMWDLPLPEIIARCLIFEFGDKDTPDDRAKASHAIINRMLRNFEDGRSFTGGQFSNNGKFQSENRLYNERQFKELLFGPNQFTTIYFLNKFKAPDQTKSLDNYMKGRSSYTLSNYLGKSGGKEAWQQACYMGTILAAMFENLQTPGQMYKEFYTHSPERWQGLARDYHLTFDGILRSVYTNRQFTPYSYNDFENYYDSWNSRGFYVYP